MGKKEYCDLCHPGFRPEMADNMTVQVEAWDPKQAKKTQGKICLRDLGEKKLRANEIDVPKEQKPQWSAHISRRETDS